MWSGPRNVSTAFMRSWGNREDTVVVDEPFYAHYLQVTGLDHPGRDEVIASQPTDWRRVAAMLHGPVPDERVHLLPEADGASPVARHGARVARPDSRTRS